MENSNEPRKPRYHDTAAAYALPNDAPEHQRLELQCQALEQLMHGSVFHAPVQQPKRILDVGCGTGRATIQLAAKFPDAQVIGIDLSAVPKLHPKPDNVEYVQGDFTELVKSGDDRFQPGTYDYIFSRLLELGMTDWPGYVGAIASLLAPGGWFEAHENDIALRDGNDAEITYSFSEAFHHMARSKGLNLRAGRDLRQLMQGCGLESVVEKTYKWPFFVLPEAPESKKLVMMLPVAMGSMFDKLGGDIYSSEELDRIREEMEEEFKQEQRQPRDHFKMHVVAARKQLH
ncbi:hypothetical protein LTR37_019518 [Vermiconidia calcicola]|uniref:Uncharacterized protein n=1 Tax=Vermiconidia calcicola TaxID=1690605 RepID=A0ACC3MDX7_9PEZI|nr:hypothetical protein LTR37_019518 [Vermiconidia calcicola]